MKIEMTFAAVFAAMGVSALGFNYSFTEPVTVAAAGPCDHVGMVSSYTYLRRSSGDTRADIVSDTAKDDLYIVGVAFAAPEMRQVPVGLEAYVAGEIKNKAMKICKQRNGLA